MTTPTDTMTADDVLAQVTSEMRARKVNGGKHESPTLIAWADRIDAAVAAVYDERDALQRRVAELETDAARWQHARKLLAIDDIESAQHSLEAYGGLVSEDESKRADEAIDVARSKGGAS